MKRFAALFGITRTEFFAALGITALIFAGLVMVVKNAENPEHINKAVCRNNLKQIGLALHKYHADFGSLPPAHVADENGKPMHSWRVLLLPYLELKEWYQQYNFDEPWNGPNNSKLAEKLPGVYECPSQYDYATRFTTGYLAVLGPQTPWPGSGTTKWQEIADGRDTILIVESHVSVHWMEPRDLEFDQMIFSINDRRGRGIGSNHFTPRLFFQKSDFGAHVLLTDGEVRYLGNRFDPEAVRALLTINGGEAMHLN